MGVAVGFKLVGRGVGRVGWAVSVGIEVGLSVRVNASEPYTRHNSAGFLLKGQVLLHTPSCHTQEYLTRSQSS